MKKISVIIPVYNTEKYVEKCLNSVFNQTFKNLEIIIVNDGSKDNSENIIKKWIEEHKIGMEIKYFKKENGGLSDARNYGVERATGDYITFIDSDDYIEEGLYESLKKYINENIDLIKFKAITLDENGGNKEKLEGPVFEIVVSGEEAFEKLCTEDKYLEVAWLYLYRREFFINNKFKYEKGIYHEDFGLTPFVIVQAQSVVSINYYGYYYIKRENSITNNKSTEKEIKKAYDVLSCFDKAIKKIEEINVDNKTKVLVKRYYTNSLLLKANSLKEGQTQFIKEIKKRKVYKNIKATDFKQLIKKMLIMLNIRLYLKMR